MDLDGRKFNREREALQRMQEFQHPFVTRFVSEHRDDQYRFLAMPYVGGLSDLFALLMKAGPRLPQAHVRFYAGELSLALEHMHAHGLIHRDVKLENVMRGMDGHLTLIDLGCSKVRGPGVGPDEERSGTVTGTPDFMAPEVLRNQPYSCKVDYWALGCIIYELLTGKSPFAGADADATVRAVLAEQVEYPDILSASAVECIKSLVCPAATRLTHAGLTELPFFSGLDWKALEAKQIAAP